MPSFASKIIERSAGATGRQDVIVQLAQHIGHELPHGIIVVDHEDAGRKIRVDATIVDARIDSLLREIGARQKNPDRGAFAFDRIDAHTAIRLFGKAKHLTQAGAGALANLLGGKERFEHPRSDRCTHARPGV